MAGGDDAGGDSGHTLNLHLAACAAVPPSLLASSPNGAIDFIPDNLKDLLGLSNVVYIAGKAIGPNSVGELDSKLSDLRNAELVWLGTVGTAVKPLPSQSAKLDAAMTAAPEKYQAYLGLAREAARMLKALYGAEGTRFKSDPIADSELMPIFS